jgi:ubiquinone biosynthesis protein
MAKLLTLLFEVTELFDMATRPELILLQKTMVVVEGVARTLDPAFNMWKTAEPVVSGWIAGNLGPRGMMVDARDGAKALLTLARQAPELAARTDRLSREIDLMAEHGLRFDESTARAIGKAEARYSRSGRLALWVIALTLVYIAWKII